ncbi:MAG: hypothetical protein AB1390_08760 [Nitrospirota bacterium]
MQKLRRLFRNITLLNVILTAAIIIFVNNLFIPLYTVKTQHIPSADKKKTADLADQETPEVHILSPTDYSAISENNLFHPERKIPVEKKEEQPLPKPEFVLYGTLITDYLSLAYIEDLKMPLTTPGRGKRQTVLRKGDIMSGFTLAEIDTDKVVMVRGEEKMMLYLHDPTKTKTRELPPPVSTGATGVSRQGTVTPPARPPVSSKPRVIPQPSQQSPQPVVTEVLPPQSPEEQSIVDFLRK